MASTSDQLGLTGNPHRPHCGVCCIIPPEILRHIANAEGVSERSRQIAKKSLEHTAVIHQARVAAVSRGSTTQSIVQPEIYQAILHSEQASPQAKESARRRLEDVGTRKEARETAARSHPSAKRLFRELHTAEGTDELPGPLLFNEGHEDQSNDEGALEVYANFKSVFDFYFEVFSRNSIDDRGGALVGVVHYDDDNGQTKGFFNAFYDGTEMAFGDGDDEIFTSFTKLVDITGHELTHGVTAMTAALPSEFQAGALNESVSDVFGSMVKQYANKQTADQADWLIGAGLFLVENAPALRNMAHPGTAHNNIGFIGKDNQGADMDHYRDQENTPAGDFGGVHVNCGIPNRAFYLVSTALGGFSWEKAGKIWYAALTDRKLRNIDTKTAFKTFADLTCKHASELPGDDGEKALAACREAWTTVKVYR